MPKPIRHELPEHLLTSAAIEFARRGFHPVRLDEIATLVGVTKGALYFHFRGKLDVFLRALARLESIRDARLESVSGNDAREELRGLLLARLAFHADHPELRRLHWILDTELEHEPLAAARGGIRADYRALRARMRQLLQQAARSGLVDLQDPAEEAFRLAACLEGTLSQHSASREDVALFWDVERLVDGWIAPLLPRGRRRGRTTEERPEQQGEDFQPAF